MEGKENHHKANAGVPTVTNEIPSDAKVLHDVPFAELTGTLCTDIRFGPPRHYCLAGKVLDWLCAVGSQTRGIQD